MMDRMERRVDISEEDQVQRIKTPGKKKNSKHSDEYVSPVAATPLKLNLTRSLVRKLQTKAQSEGISVEEFASELIAEGLVLRAWEIMERKSTLRSGASSNSSVSNYGGGRIGGKSGHRYQGSQQRRGNASAGVQNNQSQGGNGHSHRKVNYNRILDDNANFIEYVRSQEKKDR